MTDQATPALAQPATMCHCKDRPASECPGEWEFGCDLGANPAHVRVYQPAASEKPVAHLWQHTETGRTRIVMSDQIITVNESWRVVGPLYLNAAPQLAPARVPLTDDQILNIIDDVLEGGSLVDVARAIEAAHGITPAKEA